MDMTGKVDSSLRKNNCSPMFPPNLSRWGFKCFDFSPLLGERIKFDQYFSDGLKNHQLVVVYNEFFIEEFTFGVDRFIVLSSFDEK